MRFAELMRHEFVFSPNPDHEGHQIQCDAQHGLVGMNGQSCSEHSSKNARVNWMPDVAVRARSNQLVAVFERNIGTPVFSKVISSASCERKSAQRDQDTEIIDGNGAIDSMSVQADPLWRKDQEDENGRCRHVRGSAPKALRENILRTEEGIQKPKDSPRLPEPSTDEYARIFNHFRDYQI